MKKKISLFAAFFAVLALSAQVEKGAIVLMGGGGFYSFTSTDQGPGDDDEFKISGQFLDFGGQFLLTDAIGVGLTLDLSSQNGFDNGDKTYRETLNGATLFGRYYSPCGSPRFYTYGELGVNFAAGQSLSYDEEGNVVDFLSDDISQFGFGIRPGIMYFLTPAISIEASFGALAWSQTTYTNQEDNDFSTVNTNLEFFAFSKSLQFGFSWWLGRGGQSFK
jgi:hypothetical protein